jgi:hypothetical protein
MVGQRGTRRHRSRDGRGDDRVLRLGHVVPSQSRAGPFRHDGPHGGDTALRALLGEVKDDGLMVTVGTGVMDSGETPLH